MTAIDFSPQVCACAECEAICQHRPCWPTPDDVQRLVEAGCTDRLMVDWWFDRGKRKTIYLLTSAIVGRESGEAPAHPEGLHEQIARIWDDAQAQVLPDRWKANPLRGRCSLFGATSFAKL